MEKSTEYKDEAIKLIVDEREYLVEHLLKDGSHTYSVSIGGMKLSASHKNENTAQKEIKKLIRAREKQLVAEEFELEKLRRWNSGSPIRGENK